jgi:zinc transport system permease protein
MGIIGSIAGIYISYFLNIPSGATIIFSFVVIFAIAKVIQTIHVKMMVKKQIKKQ